MKQSTFILRQTSITAGVLTLLDIFQRLLTYKEFGAEGIPFQLLSNFLLSFIMAIYVAHSTLSGHKLTLVTFMIAYVIGSFNILIEALIFNVTDNMQTITGMLIGIIKFSALSISLTTLLGNNNRESYIMRYPSRTALMWSLRLMCAAVLYVVTYFAAGLTLQFSYPALTEFYQGKIPDPALIVNTQILRGIIFTGVSLVIIYTIRTNRLQTSIITGCIFSVVGGIAPLIPINEFLPFNIRLVHGIEVGISNFAYGFVITQLLQSHSTHQPKHQLIM